MILLCDLEHIYIILIAKWRKRLLVAETSAILRTLYFCIACAVSAVLAVIAVLQNRRNRNNCILYFAFNLNNKSA